jgi:transcriptional regulator with XRE-family HTH domain
MENSYSFGTWLKHRRCSLLLTQAELARRIGVATVTVQKLEADERRPSRQIAELLATALEIPPDEHARFLGCGSRATRADWRAAVAGGAPDYKRRVSETRTARYGAGG